MKRKVLVSGGYGLIGSAIANKHIAEGDEVYVWDNLSNSYNDYSQHNRMGVELYGKFYNLRLAIEHIKPDIISHQAASVGVGESMYKLEKYTGNNVQLTSELLEGVLKLNYKPTLILASSMGPYGEGDYWCKECDRQFYYRYKRESIKMKCPSCLEPIRPLFLDELTERVPQSIYAATKLMQEEMFRIFSQAYDIPTIALRYFSVYGTEQNPNNPFTGVLSIIAAKILNNDKVELFEDGEQTRDLIHVKDVADAHYAATIAKNLKTFEAINIATGVSTTMKSIAEKMISIMSPNKPLVFDNTMRKGDIKHSKAEISKAKNLLNWWSKIKLEDSIVEYCDYVLKNEKLFKKEEDSTQIENDKLKSIGLIK